MIGYKLFNPQWQAIMGKGGSSHPYQYEIGKNYEESDIPRVGGTGFHFCENLIDCFRFYSVDVHNRIGLIDAYGEVHNRNGVCSTNKMRILREVHWYEVEEIIEKGEHI